jgi:hypothetical protein
MISDLNRSSKQKADEMKRQIREKIGNMLGRFLYCMLFIVLSLKGTKNLAKSGDYRRRECINAIQ